jgi:hypothetical protein
MKKMNKMYEAPKAEVVELNVKNVFMAGGAGDDSMQTLPSDDF